MKSSKKLKSGQLLLPTLPTVAQKAAMDTALMPGPENPFLTRNDQTSSAGLDVTDYDYEITGVRDEWICTMYLTKEYIPGTVKVYLNGMRLTRGTHYDFREVTGNIILINNGPLSQDDLLIVDYKSLT
jgi:hypothetical protein